MENQEKTSTKSDDSGLDPINKEVDISTDRPDDDATLRILNPDDLPSGTSNLPDSTAMIEQLNVPEESINDGHRIDSNLNPSILPDSPSTSSQSEINDIPKYVPPHIRNKGSIGETENRGVVRYEPIQPMSSTSTMSRRSIINDGGSVWGTTKKEVWSKNRGRARSYNDRAEVRGRTNFSVNQRNYIDRYNSRRGRGITSQYLDDLLNLDDEKFVLKISTNMRCLNEFVEEVNLSDDTYVLIIKILKKIFDSRFPNSQQVLLQTILKEQFVNNLQKYLGSLPMQDIHQKAQNSYFWKEPDAFWKTLIEVSRKALEILPNYASTVLPKVVFALRICIPAFEQHQNQHVSDEIKKTLDEVEKILEETKLRFEDDVIHNKTEKPTNAIDEPPDDFRTISVYPNTTEILNECSYLRPNVVDGPYRDANHYLDVQFRLLREDFVSPLRSGVHSILSGENIRHENIRVHKNIRFLCQETVNENHCVRLKFNFTKKASNFKYEHSKKFMFGTLLCFTRDNFATLKFARVVKRDMADLECGELVVGFDLPQTDLSYDHEYLMIECSIYFEPYFHVLKALKNIRENELAMTEYIVNVKKEHDLPEYLNQDVIYKIDGRKFSIDDLLETTDNFGALNDSQKNAFIGALTRELALIQGPPGTGKTFLGLKIAKVLLNNSIFWWRETPMLVICFTNHALDQFLEGLLGTTARIVRIGGQSRNKSLNEYNLTEWRKRVDNYATSCSRYEVKNALKELECITAQIKEIDQHIGILPFSVFRSVIPDLKENEFSTLFAGYSVNMLLFDNDQDQNPGGKANKNDADLDSTKNVDNSSERNNDGENFLLEDDNNINRNRRRLFDLFFAQHAFDDTDSEKTLSKLGNEIEVLKNELDLRASDPEMAIKLSRKYKSEETDYLVEFMIRLEKYHKILKSGMSNAENSTENHQGQNPGWKLNEHDADVDRTKNLDNLSERDNDEDDLWAEYDDYMNRHHPLLELFFAQCEKNNTNFIISLSELDNEMNQLRKELDLRGKDPEMAIKLSRKYKFVKSGRLVKFLMDLEEYYKNLKIRMSQVKIAMEKRQIRTDINATKSWSLSCDERWALYTFWLDSYKQYLQREAITLTNRFQGLYKQYEEVLNVQDTHLLRRVQVVGMTTTSAARLRLVLEGLHSPIVIVEEAAEVLEAHIITALTKHCQHLILIGDHKQLKPSSADYTITHKYKLGISLFERMFINGIKCHSLNVQHRMRPEISRLICPTIYHDLKDHESVFNRPPISGIDSCIRFVDHRHLEVDCGDSPTKKNLHEVKFAVALARYLVLNGYKPEQVTILAAYLGQMYAMSRERDSRGAILNNVRVVALDNYQGEESDIIILSLVRSNTLGKIGFLATENRVCVALSRAKLGFYMIGNMELLSDNSKLWVKIKKSLEAQNAIGPDLVLRCEVHADIITLVSSGEDFAQVPEGGCNQICNAKLVCGHNCQSVCHIQDREHDKYKCFARCNKKLCDKNENHICLMMCFQECGPCTYKVQETLSCGHEISLECHINPQTYECLELVTAKLPCDHVADKPCHISADRFICPMPCEVTIDPCGHSCKRNCHFHNDPDHIEYQCMKKCARPRLGCTMEPDSAKHLCSKFCFENCTPCDIPIQKRRKDCTHMDVVACYEDVNVIECNKPCTKVLNCGHKCKKLCCEPCEPSACRVKVKKILPDCGHIVKTLCHHDPNRSLCDKKCPLKLPCGHPCTNRCNQVCTPQCEVVVDCQEEMACGHVFVRMQCHNLTSGFAKNDRTLLANCSQPCDTVLKCGHRCAGTCGECSQGRFHIRCLEKCGVPLVCNHECSFPCREACRPCSKPCSYRCVHSVCKRKCGDICIPCKEPCQRRCEHQRCSQFCSSICDVPPCAEPCSKLLACGHACIGFCGDPCPPKCLLCDREELLVNEMLFGYEDENSRFVFLVDCKHVIESEGMKQWLKMSDDPTAIGVKVCPKCKAPIRRTLRYSDDIKHAIADVNNVKLKAVGSPDEITTIRQNLKERIEILRARLQPSIWKMYLRRLEMGLEPVRKQVRQNLDKVQLIAMTAKLQVLEKIVKICMNDDEINFCPQYQGDIHNVLSRDIDYITDQEIEDITSELQRLLRAVQYKRMKRSPIFIQSSTTNAEIKQLAENIEITLGHLGPYSDDVKLKSWLEELKEKVGVYEPLTDTENRDIVRAMGMGRGHWFKCPNGHVYAIGECGGAVRVSKCNECGEGIGGQSYTLLANNSLAPEMDGAKSPYSEMANDMGDSIDLM